LAVAVVAELLQDFPVVQAVAVGLMQIVLPMLAVQALADKAMQAVLGYTRWEYPKLVVVAAVLLLRVVMLRAIMVVQAALDHQVQYQALL